MGNSTDPSHTSAAIDGSCHPIAIRVNSVVTNKARLILVGIAILLASGETHSQVPNLKFPVRSTQELRWRVTYGSPAHINKDRYALDLNLVSGGNSDFGQPVLAAANGTVILPDPDFNSNGIGYGYWVIIDHGNDYWTVYGHMDAVIVRHGQTVIQGQVVGTVGDSGTSGSYHLHFALWRNNQAVELTTLEDFSFGETDILSTNQMRRPVAILESSDSPSGFYDSDMAREVSNRFHGFKEFLGWPSDDGSGDLLHEWRSAPGDANWRWPGFYIQNFNGGTWGSSAIIYNKTLNRAPTVHGGFWNVFRYGVGDNSESDPGSGYGPTIMVGGSELGFPETDEIQDGSNVVQIFTNGMMVWDGSDVHLYTKPGESAPARYVYTTSDEGPQILLPRSTEIRKDSINLQFTPLPGAYQYGIWEGGRLLSTSAFPSAAIAEASNPEDGEGELSFMVDGLLPGRHYTFQVVGIDESFRSVGYSNQIQLRTHWVQPDVLVGPSLWRMSGDGVYNSHGSKQDVFISTRKRAFASYFLFENDGDISDSFVARAIHSGRRFKVDYLTYSQSGLQRITGALKVGLYSLTMEPGDRRIVLSRVRKSIGRVRRMSSGSVKLSTIARTDGEVDVGRIRFVMRR